MFKLPIQYVSHQSVPSSVKNELELIVSTETPIYHRLFMPPPEWLDTANELASYYTTDTHFLQESRCLHRNYSPVQSDFIGQWKELKGNKEFKLSYQYLESSWVSSFNESPSFLFTISMYFITSPILFVLTPLILLLFPFLMLLRQGIDLTWSNYYKMFQLYSSNHPLFAISNYFKVSSSQQMNLIAALTFFFVQLYVNVYTLYSFYKNITKVHKVMILAKQYVKDTLSCIVELKDTICTLPSYRDFYEELVVRETLLKKYSTKWTVPTNLWYCGSNRTFFYELYHTKELNNLIEYTIGLHGYLHCMTKLKKLQVCSFSTVTKFTNAYYPIENPVKNTYKLKNRIVTGPNASGKTTFLKMTMINVLLSQQFGCGFYKAATICPYETFACYVNIPDTCGRDSLFQAEARRCKEIIDADKTKRTLCIFDELFSGTNPEEAIATGSSMLRYLVKYPTFDFLMTTHFVELCKVLKNEISMKQMEDYKLKSGISFIKGGIRVLEEMNFPSSIVAESKDIMRINK